jgi:methyl-accepting chemotaxis protein
MKRILFSHINKWLLLFWAVVMATTIATFLFMYAEIADTVNTMASAQRTNTDPSSHTSHHPDAPNVGLAGLKIRLMLLMTGGILVIGGLGFLWIRIASRRLSRPIRVLSHALSRLSRGKLNETVTLDGTDEFSQIAIGINELAANLQELLLYIWKQSGQCLEKIKHLENSGGQKDLEQMPAESMMHLRELNKAVHDLRDMAKAYVFYDVYLDGEKTLAINDPNDPSDSDEPSI